MAVAPSAAAGGTGYNLSYSHAAGSSSNSAVDLVALSTNDPGGLTVSVSFTVSGTLNLASENYVYELFFGGSAESNATDWVIFTNNSTAGETFGSTGNGGGFAYVPYTLSGGGSTLSFAINKSAVGPSSSFSANAYAAAGLLSSGSFTYSWLGSDYLGLGGGGGGTCTGVTPSSCTSTAVSNAIAWWIYGAIATLIVVVVIVVIVVVVVMRKKKSPPPPPMMAPPPAPMGGTAPMPPPPPPPQ